MVLPRKLAGLAALAASVTVSAQQLPVSDVAESLSLAGSAFLDGRPDEARKHYRYLSTLGIKSPDPDPSIALLHRDMAEPDAALPVWTKASLSEDADGFVWNQRGWSYLALGDSREAGESFRKSLDISTTTSMQAEANIGLALTAIRDDHSKAAMPPLKEAWLQGPFILPIAAYLTGLAKLAVDDEHAALEYLGQAVDRDPKNLEALKDLARLSARVGENQKAWHYYQSILRIDPADEDSASKSEKAARTIVGDPKRLTPVRRLSRPFLDPAGKGLAPPSESKERVRVALFAGENGEPSHLLRTYFMTNAPFQVVARQDEVIRDIPAGGLQWEVIFREESNLVEVRDTAHILQYTSKQPFRIVPQARGGSVLIKSAEMRGTAVADPGDRETRGTIEVVPTPYGFVLINDLPLEDYLYGAVSAAMPPGTPIEAYKAQAVVSRTRTMWAKAHPVGGPFPHDLCDAPHCQRYIGLNSETAAAVQAVAATEGSFLRHLNGMLAEVRQHAHCGGVTEPGPDLLAHLRPVSDGPGPGPRLDSPESLERWIHAAPAFDRYCEQGGLTPAVESRWIRILDAREVTARARRLREIGKVRHLRVLKRSPSGRILSLEVAGASDTLVLNGPEAIGSVLSPGSLRSTLFTILPLYTGRSPTHFILWGAGTGSGLGMCSAGAIGQASINRKHHEILSHYFPGLVLWSPRAREFKPQAAPSKKRKARRDKRPDKRP